MDRRVDFTKLRTTRIRRLLVAENVLIFCEDIDHAERMRQAIVNACPERVKESHRYVMRITGDNEERQPRRLLPSGTLTFQSICQQQDVGPARYRLTDDPNAKVLLETAQGNMIPMCHDLARMGAATAWPICR